MKKRFVYIMLVLLLFSYNSISAYEYHDEISGLEYLLNRRIDAMNEFLYGEKDMDVLEDKLNGIEVEELLENDLCILEKVIDNPTDYELAMNVEVYKINSLNRTEGKLLINADLNWMMSGYDGEFNMVRNYDIKCVEVSGQMYLTSLSILND
jgi:hypothetical protein